MFMCDEYCTLWLDHTKSAFSQTASSMYLPGLPLEQCVFLVYSYDKAGSDY